MYIHKFVIYRGQICISLCDLGPDTIISCLSCINSTWTDKFKPLGAWLS